MCKKTRLTILICFICLTAVYPCSAYCFEPDLFLNRAHEYTKKGRYLEALSFYRDVFINNWADQKTIRFYKGYADLCNEYLGDRDSALALYTIILDNFPKKSNAAIYHSIAKTYYNRGEHKKAAEFYMDINSLFPAYYRDNNIENELLSLEQKSIPHNAIILSDNNPLPTHVRVLLQETIETLNISSEGSLEISSPDSSFFKKTPPGSVIQLSVQNNRLCLGQGCLLSGYICIKAVDKQGISINGMAYRGFFMVHIKSGRMMLINHVSLDNYLYGVLPREISHSWPKSALKAQAVAARTYALYHMAKRKNQSWDVFSTTTSQVYGGKNPEHPATREAVDLTKGLILSYDNKIILTLYHANSGGKTESIQGAWGSPLPYLGNVVDEFSINRPGFAWKKKLSREKIQQRLVEFGLPVSFIKDIVPIERTVTGRIKIIKISQKNGPFYLTGNSFRLIVGPGIVKSSNFKVRQKDNMFIFEGKGYGHGVGMSQWGAYSMAKKGHDFKEILAFYYQGTSLYSLNNSN